MLKGGANRAGVQDRIHFGCDLRLQMLERNQGDDLMTFASPRMCWDRCTRADNKSNETKQSFGEHVLLDFIGATPGARLFQKSINNKRQSAVSLKVPSLPSGSNARRNLTRLNVLETYSSSSWSI